MPSLNARIVAIRSVCLHLIAQKIGEKMLNKPPRPVNVGATLYDCRPGGQTRPCPDFQRRLAHGAALATVALASWCSMTDPPPVSLTPGRRRGAAG